VFTFSFLLLYPLFYFTIKTQRLETAFKLKRFWSFCVTYLIGIVPRIIYKSHTKKLPRPCVIVANHTSYLDIVISPFYIDHIAIYMGKAELLKLPLFKTFFKGMDIPVKRTSKVEAHKALKLAGEEIDKGRSMVIYPEGTISSHGKLRSFKSGAFKLAIDKQVPIVPVVNLNNWKLLQNGGFFKSNGCIGFANVVVLEPINTKGMTEENLVDLRERVFKLINDTLIEYNGTKN